jgi:transglutaminase superfamily protein
MVAKDALRKARAAGFSTPATTWLVMRMLGWSVVLPGLKHVLPLRVLVRVMWSRPRGGRRPDRERVIIFAAQRIFRLRPFLRRDNCLERSLLAYRYLSAAGADPRLIVGMEKSDDAYAGHAWVLVDDSPVLDVHGTLDRYVILTEFAGPRPAEPA